MYVYDLTSTEIENSNFPRFLVHFFKQIIINIEIVLQKKVYIINWVKTKI